MAQLRLKTTKELIYQNIQFDIDMLQQGNLPDYVNKYGSLLYDKTAFLGDYFAKDGLVVFDELGRIQEIMDAWEREEEEWFLSLIEEGKISDYEEVFRTWKMVPDTLAKREMILFDKFVRGESLTPYETKNSGGVEYIEFPDERTYFDKQAKQWKSK